MKKITNQNVLETFLVYFKVCVYLHLCSCSRICRHSQRTEDGVRFLGAGVTSGYKQPGMSAGNQNLAPWKNSVIFFLTTEPFLQPNTSEFYK